MALLASDVLDAAPGLLNDPAKSVVTDAVMLPYLRLANEDLQDALVLSGLQPLEEKVTGLSIPANTTSLNGLGTGPTDMLEPIAVAERASGSADQYVPLNYHRLYLPRREKTDILGDWTYQEEDIRFVGATVSREIELWYYRQIGSISGAGTALLMLSSKGYLVNKLAAYVAYFALEMPERGAVLDGIATGKLEELKNRYVRLGQNVQTVRRRPHSYNKRARWPRPRIG